MSDYSVFEMLEAGDDSVRARRTASNKVLASTLATVNNEFGPYLANAEDHDEFIERLSAIRPDLEDLVLEKTGSLDGINNVLRSLSWNFDKKDDDSDDSDDDKSSDDDSDSDKSSTDDKDDSDSDSDDDSDVPDFVDTDDDDDKERKESSYRFAEDIEDGFVRDLTDESLEPNVVEEDFDGDVNDLESSKGAYTVTADRLGPQHLNPVNPGGPQWEADPESEYSTTQRVVTPHAEGNVYNFGNDESGTGAGIWPNAGGGGNIAYPGQGWGKDKARAEVEKGIADVHEQNGQPIGRHRASNLPFVPRIAAPQHLNPEPPAAGSHTWNQDGFDLNLQNNADGAVDGAVGMIPGQNGNYGGGAWNGTTQNNPVQISNPSPQHVMNEVENNIPQVGQPGRHREDLSNPGAHQVPPGQNSTIQNHDLNAWENRQPDRTNVPGAHRAARTLPKVPRNAK